LGFLSSQKLHQQVVVLERQIPALEKSGQHTDVRVEALERELAVRALRQRRKKIRKAQRALGGLKPLCKKDRELAASVRSLRARLQQIDNKLKQEINSRHPRLTFSAGERPLAPPIPPIAAHPCLRGPRAQAGAARIECQNGVCRLVPEKRSPVQTPAEAVAIEVVKKPAAATAPHGAVKKEPARPAAKPTWWSRVINWRIFGGN
jgi:small-conductance mechanosensitive channel